MQGDDVCLYEDKMPRNLWRLGKVESLTWGKDGHFRASVVNVLSKGKNVTMLQRPIQKLYPAEGSQPKVGQGVPRRSKRIAAIEEVKNSLLTKKYKLYTFVSQSGGVCAKVNVTFTGD